MKVETPLLALLVAAHTEDAELVAIAVRVAAQQVKPAGFAAFVEASREALTESQHRWLTEALREQY